MFNVIVFGPPGSGKGTQSRNIVRAFNLIHLSTGDMLRDEIRKSSAIGELISKFVDRGYLVPDSIIFRELFLEAMKFQNAKGLIFDGFPRNVKQAEILDRMLEKKKMKVDKVISLEVEENELVRRILGRSKKYGRTDDTEDVIRNRFIVYEKETLPLKKYYENAGKLCSVSGMAPIPTVFNRIKICIDNSIKKKS